MSDDASSAAPINAAPSIPGARHGAATGGFVLVVGPSGAGKDTVIAGARAALAGDDRFVFARRVVTRPSSAWEDHDSLSPEAFGEARAAGRFALDWDAHGLSYALPAQTLLDARAGRIVVANVSRQVVPGARSRLPGVSVVEVTAAPETLARRLAGRARAEDGDLRVRLHRSATLAPVAAELVIHNDGRPEDAVALLLEHLRGRR
ncbi:phosphonate metabolism protein/1,5-bisphosphokinase (PRPP-forming) PhnN [Roseomonas elaeocarpi]|uniref:Ribose 1,5-bisphosphate phosphokinase PhnN n=1 Tax=Roseomonas elaeocarpi TaxID=907779 RepID=A0ABV6JRG4_9PROT